MVYRYRWCNLLNFTYIIQHQPLHHSSNDSDYYFAHILLQEGDAVYIHYPVDKINIALFLLFAELSPH